MSNYTEEIKRRLSSSLGFRKKDLKLINVDGTKYVFLLKTKIIVVKLLVNKPNRWVEFELRRRRKAHSYCLNELKEYTLDISLFKMSLSYKKVMLIKITELFRNVKEINNLTIKEIVNNKDILYAINKISKFSLKHILFKNKFFDFFYRFKEIDYIKKILIPRNIYIGINKNGNKKIFIDSDWYVQLSDKEITGYKLFAYLTRFYQGGLIMSTSFIFSFIILFFTKYEHITSNC
jgi:hypothetical protein